MCDQGPNRWLGETLESAFERELGYRSANNVVSDCYL